MSDMRELRNMLRTRLRIRKRWTDVMGNRHVIDDDGREHFLDHNGVRHWYDDDGREHVDLTGEQILHLNLDFDF